MFSEEFVYGSACDFCSSEIEVIRQMRHPIIGQRDGLRIERIRFEDFRARFEVLAVNAFDNVRLRNRKQIVVVFQITMPVFELLAAIVGFFQLVALNHRTHRAVNDDDALGE